jgi:hypothetical protein
MTAFGLKIEGGAEKKRVAVQAEPGWWHPDRVYGRVRKS